jgi:hypothetical protein
MKIILFAPIYSRSGYGDHSREVVSYLLNDDDIDLNIAPVSWGKNSDSYYTHESELIQKINDKVITTINDKQYDVCITIGMPTEFKHIGDYNIGITAGVETTRISKEFIYHSNKMDLLIVPSNFTRNIFEKTKYINDSQNELSLTCEIQVVPEYASPLFYKKKTDLNKDILKDVKEDFCFLSVGQWISSDTDDGGRKNFASLIDTFVNAFRQHKNKPALILKTNGCNYSITDKIKVEKKIRTHLELYEERGRPNVYLLHGDLNEQQMYDLYNNTKVKCFVSHTKGEGFGRPMLEASLSELPIICPKFSGYLDFLNDDNSTLINGKLLDVGVTNSLFCENAKWIHVDEEKSKNAMIDVYENYKVYKEKIKNHTPSLLNNYSIQTSHKKYNDIFTKLK